MLLEISPKEFLDIAGVLATVIGFPLTIYSIIKANMNTRRSIDVQIITSLSIYFNEKWNDEWGPLMDNGDPLSELTSDAQRRSFYSLLNWIDWVGTLIRRGAFSDPTLMFETIGINMRHAILLSNDVLNDQGQNFWPGVFEVARRLGLTDKKGKICMDLADLSKIQGIMQSAR